MDSGGDVTYWFKREDGISDLGDGDRAVFWRIDGSGIGDTDFLLCVNMRPCETAFSLPPAHAGKSWQRIADTADWAEMHGNCWLPQAADPVAGSYVVHPWSLAILQEI